MSKTPKQLGSLKKATHREYDMYVKTHTYSTYDNTSYGVGVHKTLNVISNSPLDNWYPETMYEYKGGKLSYVSRYEPK